MSQRLRVLVVDDSAYIRKVVKEMLSSHPSIEVVGTARDGEEALDLVERLGMVLDDPQDRLVAEPVVDGGSHRRPFT